MLAIAVFGLLSVAHSQEKRPVAINLTAVHDYSTELVFTDAFKQSREWIVHETGPNAPWESKGEVPLGPEGYPLKIPYKQEGQPELAVRTLMLWDLEGHYPKGDYRLIAKGEGHIQLWGAASGTFTTPVDTPVTVNPADGGVALEINRSEEENPVHQIRFIYPGYTQTYQNQTFRTDFLEFVQHFDAIRFMDWLRTNGSEVEAWSDRTPKNYYTQAAENGVAWEYITKLCNQTQKDAWICIPHKANDDYIKQLAIFLKNNLNPSLKIYLEYSNEVWNGTFPQHHEAAAMASEAGYSGEEWERAWKFTAKRSADIFYRFQQVFEDTSRLEKIIPSQSANSGLSEQLINYFQKEKYNPQQVKADALAIAPYFGGSVADKIAERELVDEVTVSDILDSLRNALPTSYQSMDAQKAVAKEYGYSLLAYEGGQHLVATGSHVNNEALTKKLIAANRHSTMQDLYCRYFEHWYDNTGADMFAVFSSHGLPSKWGSWAIKEHMQDTLAPKFQAIQSCVFTNTEESIPETSGVKVYPNPSRTGTFRITHNMQSPDIKVYNLTGRQIPATVRVENRYQLQVTTDYNGIIILRLIGQKQQKTIKVMSIKQ